MTFFFLALASIVGWFISTLAGGGSSFILMPIIGMFLGAQAIPSIITIGGIFGNSERVYVYWNQINWQILKWDLPGATVGAILGAFTLSQLNLEWVTILVAGFLIVSAISFFFQKNEQSFPVKTWYFLPSGFIYAFLSGLIGSIGPLLAPFYINYGLKKEEILATQATNRILIHSIKVIAYWFFGNLQISYVGYGILIGLASFPGNFLGGLVLDKISEKIFRRLVFSFVLFSGLLILWQHREMFWRSGSILLG